MPMSVPLFLFDGLFDRFKCVVFIAVIAVLAVGCTGRDSGVEVEYPGGVRARLDPKETLRINLTSEPPTLDWHKAADTVSALITANLMEGLTQYNLADKDLGLEPGLATKWEPTDQARKWKITLRDDVRWSDGVPFNPQHVVDGWRRLLDRATSSEYAYFLYGIKNARDFSEGKKPWSEVGVRVTGANEISVELEKSMSYFPYLLTHQSTYPIRQDVVDKGGNLWTDPSRIVTLGPYVLKAWQHDKMIVLERNDLYYGEKAKIKNIVAYMLQEQATAINLFDSGKLDAVHSLPSVELKKLRTRPEFRETSRLATYYYGMNVTKPPLNEPLVRRALSMAIDRRQLVQMLAGGQVPLSGWIPGGILGYETARGTTFDPQRAKELLKKAGYADPSTLAKIEIKFNTNEDHQRIAENIQAQLKTNLGINVELKNEEWKVFLNSLKTDPPQIFRMGWQADFPDPDNFMSLMTSFSENNHTRWKNAKYDELVARAAGTTEREERKRLYSQAQKIMLEEDIPVIPLYTTVNQLLVSPRVEGYPINVMEIFSYKKARLR